MSNGLAELPSERLKEIVATLPVEKRTPEDEAKHRGQSAKLLEILGEECQGAEEDKP